jgi:hypothetical protein
LVRGFGRRWPELLSFALLAYQLYIPWSVKHLATQDGPAHVYTAFMAKDLVFHRHTSPYRPVYRIQKTLLPNWTCTILLAGYLGVFGPDRAEAFLMSVCLLAGYFSFAYGVRAFAPRGSPWMVAGNWLIQSWFLWSGFYNFFLGMALVPLAVGYYVRHARELDWRRAGKLALALVAVFFTHLIAAAVGAMALFLVGAWVHVWRREWKKLGWVAAAAAPALALIAVYAGRAKQAPKFEPAIRAAWDSFPQSIFVFSGGRAGEQTLLWPAMLFLIAMAILGMRGREWRSARGGLAIAAGAAFALYLLVPDFGLGGSAVKMRFAWAVFVMGALLASAVDRLRPLRGAIGVWIAFLLVCQLTAIEGQVRATSDAMDTYLTAMDRMEPGSRFVRMYYPAPEMERRFGTGNLAFHPLLHADALAAVRRHAVDLSDYQAAAGTFGVDYKPEVGEGQRYTLWGMEGPGADGVKSLEWLRGSLPVKIDYAVVMGEAPPDLGAGAKLAAVNRGAAFVRVYRLE